MEFYNLWIIYSILKLSGINAFVGLWVFHISMRFILAQYHSVMSPYNPYCRFSVHDANIYDIYDPGFL